MIALGFLISVRINYRICQSQICSYFYVRILDIGASNNISSNTTPSNARSEGQFKVTVHHVDKDGKELATQAYSYGYPAGSSIAAQSPDYQVAPKDITGYTLVTSDSPVSSLNGKQLTTSEAVPFLAHDQTVYYV